MSEMPQLEKELRKEFPYLTDSDFGYYATDLHVVAHNDVVEYLKNNYRFWSNVNVFESEIDHKAWLDIPFAGKWPIGYYPSSDI